MKQHEITIPAGCWTGYIWESDRKPHEVRVFDGEPHDALTLNASSNPFVIEALLCIDNRFTWQIRFVDGAYIATRFDIVSLDAEVQDVVEHQVIASFDKAPGRLRFREYWREEADPLCEGFAVLSPAELVFIGFE